MSSFERRLFSETERSKVHIFEGEEPKEATVYFAVCVVGSITVRDGPALWTSCGHRLVGALRDGFFGRFTVWCCPTSVCPDLVATAVHAKPNLG